MCHDSELAKVKYDHLSLSLWKKSQTELMSMVQTHCKLYLVEE